MRKNLYKLTFLLSVVLLFGFGCDKSGNENSAGQENGQKNSYNYNDINQIMGDTELANKMATGRPSLDNTKQEVLGSDRGLMMAADGFIYSVLLQDVVGGQSSGLVKAGYKDKDYKLYADFANLIEPENGDFYEGWLVRTDPFDFVSVGKAEKIGGMYSNFYSSKKDLTKYNFYVLTMETNDGNPAPAKHILEGIFMKMK